MKLAIILATLSAMFWPGPSSGSGAVQRTYASHDGLTLALSTRISGPVVTAQAKLTNTSSRPFNYYGGCAPPILQVQARDAGGHHVFGWVPPRVNCLALSVRQLAPRASIRRSAHFPILGLTRVRAAVQVKIGSGYLFQTRPLNVTPR
jgi:hypothetical protein